MNSGPRPLANSLQLAPELAGIEGVLTEDALATHLEAAAADDPLRNRLRTSLVDWDYVVVVDWSDGTAHNTVERRQRIYDLLQLRPELRQTLDRTLPHARLEEVIVIAEKFTPWYTENVRTGRNFYWSAYSSYLRAARGFAPENVAVLDDATTKVLERCTNPEQPEAYQSKGLVVGYVQSGKTANFTGVIAKAIDAGYRLVIVMSGTMDLLRNQTQRRIDMELVGKEQIRPPHLGDDTDIRFDYDDDPQWRTGFISLGGRPSEKGSFDIIRLTGAGGKGASGDYQSLKHGIQTLEIEKADKTKPLYDPVNLHQAAVRLMVVKKNAPRLKKLADDLTKIGSKSLNEVPVLIIDDESDQASINTINPDQKFLDQERKKRTAINQKIVDLLTILPRAQYVGYTATPFANVLVDLDDADDIFPKDFIISLPRPEGYMGVRDFHDLDAVTDDDSQDSPETSNEAAFVRDIWHPHDESTGPLRRAIDTFVLTGAIKLYREARGIQGDFRHHTMLAHESQRTAEHAELAALITKLWDESGYDGGGGMKRLQQLLEEDVHPVSIHRAVDGIPTPSTVDEIRSELGEVVRRIEGDGNPLLIVNSAEGAETPNFDKVPVWKILVGGAKLSRGYTIEGLTVSYFRRRARYQDTLMQMGRWFGFRPGYRDLVRLYIGRHEPLTAARKRFLDLYEAFEAICIDEEAFRQQLARYATPTDGSDPITPMQVPPLVFNSHPQLMPVARNKMFNSVLKSANIGGEWIERTQASDVDDDLIKNERLFADLLTDAGIRRSTLMVQSADGLATKTDAYWSIVSHEALTQALGAYLWEETVKHTVLAVELEFFRGKGLGDPAIDDWVILLPQLKASSRDPWEVAGRVLTTVERARVDGFGRFKAYSDPGHRRVAEIISGKVKGEATDADGKEIQRERRRGAVLLYPVWPKGIDEPELKPVLPAMGFALLPPLNDLPKRAEFTVRSKKHASDAVVTVQPEEAI